MSIFKTKEEIATATTKELVAFYNSFPGVTPIKKFRDRATAELRCFKLLTIQPAVPPAIPVTKIEKTHVVFLADISGSMRRIGGAALKDLNDQYEVTKNSSSAKQLNTTVSQIDFGGGIYQVKPDGSNIFASAFFLKPQSHYRTDGHNTPLFRAIAAAIEMSQQHFNSSVSRLICILTDGLDNVSSFEEKQYIVKQMKTLMSHDTWTFVFRIPKGFEKLQLISAGVPEGCILEWETSEYGLKTASEIHSKGMERYFSSRSAGATSLSSFYTADTSKLDEKIVSSSLSDVSADIVLYTVAPIEHDISIDAFMQKRLGRRMLKGAAFYEFTKYETAVQANKEILIRNKDTGEVFHGAAARLMIGLPYNIDAKVKPGTFIKFQVYVQSTSVNRKLKAKSTVLYYPKIGVAYKT